MSIEQAILAYRQKRIEEFTRTRKQHRRNFLNFHFGISYDEKMSACDKMLSALNNEDVAFTKNEMAALEDGELGGIIFTNANEWPASYRRQRNLPLIAELEEYKLQRTREYTALGRQCNCFILNINFGVPYDKKMRACNQILAYLNGEDFEITNDIFEALSNGRLRTIMNRYEFLLPRDLRVNRVSESALPSRLTVPHL